MLSNATAIHTKNIPNEMKEVKAWVCWREGDRDGKTTKIPTSPFNGRNINVTDPSNWMTFEDAMRYSRATGIAGIGFVFSQEHGFVGVDIDHCIDENGNLSALAEEIVETLGSYTEVSVSGTGLHIICKGTLPLGRSKDQKLGLEMYSRDRFFTVTGDVWSDCTDVEERTDELSRIHRLFVAKEQVESRGIDFVTKDKVESKRVDNVGKNRQGFAVPDVIEQMGRGKNGDMLIDLYHGDWQGYYASQSEAEIRLMNALAFYTDSDAELMDALYRESGLYRSKWDMKHSADGRTYGQMTIDDAISHTFGRSSLKSSSSNPQPKKKHDLELPPWYVLSRNGHVSFKGGILSAHLHETIPAFYMAQSYYLYEKGVYTQVENDRVLSAIQGYLIDEYMQATHVDQVFKLWKNRVYRRPDEINRDSDKHVINFQNGLFDVYTKEFMPHTPAHLATRQLNVPFSPTAECPQFLKFISEVVRPDDAPLIQEIMGYLLAPFTEAQKVFILYGPSRTGKSTLLRIVEGIIGMQNISHVTMQKLDGRFDTQSLHGKLVNLFSDLPAKPLEDIAILKALSGEDTVHADKKGKDPFSFVNKARLIFSSNHLPKVRGDSDEGFYERIIIIPFTNQVTEDRIDPHLTKKLLQEKDGILQWALLGLERLLQNNFKFSESPSSKRIKEQYRIDLDNVEWFITNFCEVSPDDKMYSTELYGIYRDMCLENGMQFESQKLFSTRLQEYFGTQIKKAQESGTKRAVFHGVRLRTPS